MFGFWQAIRAFGLFAALLAALTAVGHAKGTQGETTASWPTSWLAKGAAEHPLVGRIVTTRDAKFLTPDAYTDVLNRARFVLLGEVHDNIDHHRLQGFAIRQIKAASPRTVFEHFRTDQQGVLDAFQAGDAWMKSASGDAQLERLFLVTGWAASGWPAATMFAPLMRAVLDRDGKMLAGHPPKQRVYEVARRGLDALSMDAQRSLMLSRPLGAPLQEALLGELEASHCELMPKEAFGNMAVAQRFRDGHMARVMIDAAMMQAPAETGPVILVAGNGHVRQDRGVPWYLRAMGADGSDDGTTGSIVSVGHVEVVAGKMLPRDYARALAAYSVVVFTPRVLRADPCIAMRKRFRGKKN